MLKGKNIEIMTCFYCRTCTIYFIENIFQKKMKLDKNGPCVLIQRFVSDFTRWFTHPASLWDFPSVLSHQKTHTTKKWKACEFDAVNTAGRQIWFQMAGSDYYFLTCHRRCATEHELRIKVGGGKGCLLTTRTICHYVVHKTARRMEIRFIVLIVLALTVFCPDKDTPTTEDRTLKPMFLFLQVCYSAPQKSGSQILPLPFQNVKQLIISHIIFILFIRYNL